MVLWSISMDRARQPDVSLSFFRPRGRSAPSLSAVYATAEFGRTCSKLHRLHFRPNFSSICTTNSSDPNGWPRTAYRTQRELRGMQSRSGDKATSFSKYEEALRPLRSKIEGLTSGCPSRPAVHESHRCAPLHFADRRRRSVARFDRLTLAATRVHA